MSLKDWRERGWLVEHATSPAEIAGLLGVIERDISDSQASGLSPDWKLNIAYNAALQAATIVLYASGYRASREAHHYRVIQSLRYTMDQDGEEVALLDRFRKKRNLSDYEVSGRVSEGEAAEMLDLAKSMRDGVVEWLLRNHPDLVT